MDRAPSTTLIDDAESILGSIRRAVLLDLQEPGNQNVFGDLNGEIDALRSHTELSDEVQQEFELLRTLIRAASETSQERTRFQILDVVSSLESILVGSELAEAEFSDELLEIVEASFDSFPKTPQKSAVIETAPILHLDRPGQDESIDPELLEIFAEEAEQLLSAFQEQLRFSKTGPPNNEVLWELRRIAHTFKGAAGVVGFSAAADLAHRIENTLDRLASSPNLPFAHLLPLLEPSIEVLRDLAMGGDPNDGRIPSVQKELDLLLGDYPATPKEKHGTPVKYVSEPEPPLPAKRSNDKKVVRVSLAVLDLIDHRVREFTKTLASLRQSLDPTSGRTSPDGSFRQLFEQQFFLANSIMEELKAIRLIEFGTVTPRLQRGVRVACEEENKTAEILIENAEIKIDTVIMDQLVEPLMHLLRNSVVHGIEPSETRRLLGKPENGLIRLRINDSPVHIVVVLTDDGRGIDSNALKARALELGTITSMDAESMSAEDAFELIFQTGLSTADKLTLRAGRGIGMRIVRDAIRELNGTISIDSVRNVGTTFTITIPKLKPSSEGPDVTQDPMILSVDDSLSVRKANKKIIEDLGFISMLANGGSEALKLLNEAQRLPDLIITDLEMRGMDGFQFMAALKKSDRLSHIPIIVLSTRSDQVNRNMAFQLGAIECFEKPLDRQELRLVANVFIKN